MFNISYLKSKLNFKKASVAKKKQVTFILPALMLNYSFEVCPIDLLVVEKLLEKCLICHTHISNHNYYC